MIVFVSLYISIDPDLIENPDGFDYLPEEVIEEENNDTNDNNENSINGPLPIRSTASTVPMEEQSSSLESNVLPSLTPKGSARRIRPDGTEGPVFTSPVIYTFSTDSSSTIGVTSTESSTNLLFHSSTENNHGSLDEGSYHADDINMTVDTDEPAPSTDIPVAAEIDISCASLAMLPGALQPMEPMDTESDRVHASSPIHAAIVIVSPRALTATKTSTETTILPMTTAVEVDTVLLPVPGTGLVRSPRIEFIATLSPAKHATLPTSPARSVQQNGILSSRKKGTAKSTSKNSAVLSTGTFVRRSTRLANITSPISSFTNTTTTNYHPVTPVVGGSKEVLSNLPIVTEEITDDNSSSATTTTIDPVLYNDLPQTPAALSLRALLSSTYKTQSTNNATEESTNDSTTTMNTLLNTMSNLRISINGNTTETKQLSPPVSTTPKTVAYALSPRPGSAFQATSLVHTGSLTPRLSLSNTVTNKETDMFTLQEKTEDVATVLCPTMDTTPVTTDETAKIVVTETAVKKETFVQPVLTEKTIAKQEISASVAIIKPNNHSTVVSSSKTNSTTVSTSKPKPTTTTSSSTFSTTARRVSSTMGTTIEAIASTVATTTSASTVRNKPVNVTNATTKPAVVVPKPPTIVSNATTGTVPQVPPTAIIPSTVAKSTVSTETLVATVPTETTAINSNPKSALEKLKQRAAALASKIGNSSTATVATSKSIVSVPSSSTTVGTKETVTSTTILKENNHTTTTNARRVVVTETKPTSVPVTAATTTTTSLTGPSTAHNASSSVPTTTTSAPFIPTAILLAKFEHGVRDLPIPTTTVPNNNANKDSTTVAHPFQFATDLRAAEKKARRQSGLAVAINGVAELATNTIAAVKQAISVAPPTVPVKETSVPVALVEPLLSAKPVEATKVVAPIPVHKPTETSTTTVTKSLPLLPAPMVAPVTKLAEPVHATPATSTVTATPIVPVGHILGEIPEAVRKAAKLAHDSKENSTTNTTGTVPSTATTTTTSVSSTAGSKLDKFRDVLHRFKSGGSNPSSSTSTISAVITTSTKGGQENTAGTTTKPATISTNNTITAVATAPVHHTRAPTKAVSPALHTRRRSLERAQFQAALQNNGLQNINTAAIATNTNNATKTVSLTTTTNPTKSTTVL